MLFAGQLINRVLTTPEVEVGADGAIYFDFGVELKNGLRCSIGGHIEFGIQIISDSDFATEEWRFTDQFAELLGRQVKDVHALHGKAEPIIEFQDGMTLRITGDEVGTVVDIDSLSNIRQQRPWIFDDWISITDETEERLVAQLPR